MRRSASFGRVRSPSNCRRNKSILARQLRATKTDIGHTPILSNETVSYYIHNMWRRIFDGLAIVAAVVSLFGSAPGFASPGRSPVSWCPYHQQLSHDLWSQHSGRIQGGFVLTRFCSFPVARLKPELPPTALLCRDAPRPVVLMVFFMGGERSLSGGLEIPARPPPDRRTRQHAIRAPMEVLK